MPVSWRFSPARTATALFLGLAVMIGVLAGPPAAIAQSPDDCSAIRFARGGTSATVAGRVPPDGAICYTLAVGEGQAASVRLTSRHAAAFSMTHSRAGHDTSAVDATTALNFTTRAGVYTIWVFHMEPAPVATPFTLEASVAAGRAPAANGPPSGAVAQITAWARSQRGDYLIEPISMFFGDFTGDGAADGLAFIYSETGGSAVDLTVALFRNQSGRMAHWRNDPTVRGMEPRNVTFAPGEIRVTTTMPQPGDPRCCPTGRQTWTIRTR